MTYYVLLICYIEMSIYVYILVYTSPLLSAVICMRGYTTKKVVLKVPI